MKSNARFNTLFLGFSFALIAVVSLNLRLTQAELNTRSNNNEHITQHEQITPYNAEQNITINHHKI